MDRLLALPKVPRACGLNYHEGTMPAEEDSLVGEARILELLEQAGFAGMERVYQVHLLDAWLASKAP